MSERRSVWRQRWVLWSLSAIFVLLNLGLLFAYRLVVTGGVQALEGQLASRQTELEERRERREVLESIEERAERNRKRIDDIYGERFATEEERLTQIIAEVKDLAKRAGLSPETISYPEQEIDDYGLLKKSFVFGVEGTYPQLRQLINLLEVTDSFLTLETVGLNEQGDGSRLGIRLRLSTLFREPPRSSA